MRVLITGSKGLVGKNTATHVSANNHELLIPGKEELNLLDANQTNRWLRENNPELIIHCAGRVGGIQLNMQNPDKFLYENTVIGLNLINSAFCNGIPNLINLGSSCMYPRNTNNPIKTKQILSSELEPTNEGYALSKICIERYCKYLTNKNKSLNYKTLIPCNIYGKYDNFHPEFSHMIPGVIRRIHEAKVRHKSSVEIWGSGEARREFMYCEDLADAIWFCVERIESLPQSINIGMGKDFSILEYYKSIQEVIDFKGEFYLNKNKPIGMKQKLIDSSEINKFGWHPKFSLKEGLAATYNYFINNISPYE